MSQYSNSATKNPPWVRPGQNISMGVGQTGQMPASLMGNTIPAIANASVLQYQQQPVFQGQMGMQQMYGTVGPVSYPTRALNSAAFQSSNNSSSASSSADQSSSSKPNQKVFAGTVTKLQDNFGFVDENVFFQTSCCVKGILPQVGDRVLVEAMYNANMPFKWNATRIQVVPIPRENNMNNMQGNRPFNSMSQSPSGYNAVPPPSESSGGGGGGGGGSRFSSGSRFSGGSSSNDRRDRGRERSRPSREQDQEMERKRRRDDRDLRDREEKEKERAKSPPRKRSKSPPRAPRRARRPVPRYGVQVPKLPLDNVQGDVVELKRRYTNMYIPSDFFLAKFRWVDTFPVTKPMNLNFPCSFHVFHKEVDPVIENKSLVEPLDVDYLYSAKVMLLSSPGLDEIYSKCITLAEDRDKEGSRSTDDDQFSHPARLIQFLVGLRGKNETMAIGGPWSPSVDGENPASDPGVLIKTAIRNCRALTGIDLSACTQWFRFLEMYYHRAESVHKGKTVAARVETVVIFVPDVWSSLPTRLEWDGLHLNYQKQLARKLNKEPAADEKEETTDATKKEPKHHSELDPKNMKVNELREELEARTLSPKGLKSQLVARLSKVIKTEADEEAAKKEAPPKVDKKAEEEKKKKEDEDKKKFDERDKAAMEKRYKLPESPSIIVHPSRTAKSGKFDCSVMTLSSLLGYRQDDTKEHSFEVSLFAELFNEMLMRDFGFNIYKAMATAPEKPKEEKDEKDRKKKDEKDPKDKDAKEKDKKEDDIEEDDDEDDDDKDKRDRKDDDKKRGEKMKLVTADPHLLLSFAYFDNTRCGYIFDKDLEELIFSLGLTLSRAQVKRLVQKVVTRDSLHYRKLTDKPKEETEGEEKAAEEGESLAQLSQGNKWYLNSTGDSQTVASQEKSDTVLESGFVTYKGSLVDVGKLIDQLSRSEAGRVESEKALGKTRQECSKLKDNIQRLERYNKEINGNLRDLKDRLSNVNSELSEVNGKSRQYLNALRDIHSKVSPLIHEVEEKRHREERHRSQEGRRGHKDDDEVIIKDEPEKKKPKLENGTEEEKEKEKEEKEAEKTKTTDEAEKSEEDLVLEFKDADEEEDPLKDLGMIMDLEEN